MASLFGFRTRSPSRDRETDSMRFGRLTALLDEMKSQIEAEKAGLEKRYGDASANAGFLMDAMDSEEVSSRSSSRLDALTEDVLNCERRLETLARQVALIEDIRKRAQGFLHDGDSGQAQTGAPVSVAPDGAG